MRVPFDLLRSQRVKFETLHARIFPLFEGLSETLKKERREMYRKWCYRVRAYRKTRVHRSSKLCCFHVFEAICFFRVASKRES